MGFVKNINMKYLIIVIIAFLLSSISIRNKQKEFNVLNKKNSAFGVGEKLRYRVSYGIIDAGEVTLEVKSSKKKINNKEMYHVVGEGRTLGGFNAFYKVRDKYESYIVKDEMYPLYFKRRVNEGGYKISQDYSFFPNKNKVQTKSKSFKTPHGIQDMLSSFYYARTLDFSSIQKGKIFEFDCFMDNEVYRLKIKYVGDEIITIRKGKFSCHKFVPVVQTGRYFKSEEDVNFWITNDKNHIPVLVKAKIPVGTVKLHLVEWNGLKNNLESKQN